MPVNHAKEFLRYIHIEALFSQLFASLKYKPRTVFESITQKSFDLISSFWSDLPKNHWAGYILTDPAALPSHIFWLNPNTFGICHEEVLFPWIWNRFPQCNVFLFLVKTRDKCWAHVSFQGHKEIIDNVELK